MKERTVCLRNTGPWNWYLLLRSFNKQVGVQERLAFWSNLFKKELCYKTTLYDALRIMTGMRTDPTIKERFVFGFSDGIHRAWLK